MYFIMIFNVPNLIVWSFHSELSIEVIGIEAESVSPSYVRLSNSKWIIIWRWNSERLGQMNL